MILCACKLSQRLSNDTSYVNTSEGQVHYRTEGNGESVLFLHKAGLSSDEYSEMLPIIGKKYKAIAVDALGYGNTDLPANEPSFNDYINNLLHFVEGMNMKQFNLVGHLLGASFAVEIAATHPNLVKKLILWDCVSLESEDRKIAQEHYRKARMEYKDDGSHISEIWKSNMAQSTNNLDLVERSTIDYLKSGMGASGNISHRALFAYNVETQLPNIKCPTLLLYSKGGHMIARKDLVIKLIPDCQVKILENCGHFPYWEKAMEISEVILDFLK